MPGGTVLRENDSTGRFFRFVFRSRYCGISAKRGGGGAAEQQTTERVAKNYSKKIMVDASPWVPHYDIYGHQHHRVPFKHVPVHLADAGKEQLDRWKKEPKFRTRTELVQARLAAKVQRF